MSSTGSGNKNSASFASRGDETGTRPTTSLPVLGEVLAGKFLVERVLGEGGMCMVYGARHLQLDGDVAIKVLRPDVLAEAANPDEIIERFMREGRAASQIRSEHVVRTFDVDTLPQGGPFLVMEYLAGRDLDALLREHGPLPIAAAVDYVLQAGEAIAEAHARGIIHRDLKPANLFLTWRPDGTPFVKVLDFGISKIIRTKRKQDPALTGTSNVVGTPHYMSPEQLRGLRDIDTRTDIWAMGAILHELLSGQPPFAGTTMPEICANILKEEPSPLAPLRPEVPTDLELIVVRCLAKNPDERFATVAALATALEPFATPTGRACVQRILGIARTVMSPDQGGFRLPPRENTAPWDSDTSLSMMAHTSPPPKRRKLALAMFAVVMTVTGAILAVAFTGNRLKIEEALAPLYPSPPPAAPATVTAQQPTTTQAEISADAGSVEPPATEVVAMPTSTPTPTPTPTPTSSAGILVKPTPTEAAKVPARAPRKSVVRTRPAAPSVSPSPAPADETLFEERK